MHDNRRIELRRFLQKVSFQDLSLFQTVAEHSSLSSAARELGLRAPYVTKAVQKLERKVGAELLTRSALGVALTSDGMMFLSFCQEVAELMDQARWSKKGALPVRAVTKTVAGPMFLLAHLVAPYAARALQNEEINLRLPEMANSQMMETAQRERIDAAVHCDQLDWGRAWKTFPLGTVEWLLCGRKDHLLGAEASESEVLQFPFVVPVTLGSQGFKLVSDNCPLPVKERLKRFEVSNGEIGLNVVESSDQLIYLPEIQARSAIEHGKVRTIRVKDWAPIRKIAYLSVHQDRMSQRQVRLLVSALEAGLRRTLR